MCVCVCIDKVLKVYIHTCVCVYTFNLQYMLSSSFSICYFPVGFSHEIFLEKFFLNKDKFTKLPC